MRWCLVFWEVRSCVMIPCQFFFHLIKMRMIGFCEREKPPDLTWSQTILLNALLNYFPILEILHFPGISINPILGMEKSCTAACQERSFRGGACSLVPHLWRLKD